MEYALVTDSSCNLSTETIDRFGLHILPLSFSTGDTTFRSYLKGQNADMGAFYKMMREGNMFRTSLPSPSETEQTLREILDEGKDILYLGFSSGLSGTFDSTNMMLKMLGAEYPERKLFAVDTLAASGGEGLLVYLAAEKAMQGESIEAVRDWVEETKLSVAHWFTVDDLMYLFKGGRVTRTSAFAGTVLNVKPILHIDDNGLLVNVDKLRGRKKALNTLVQKMEEYVLEPASEQLVFITHGDCLDDALYVKDLVRERFGVERFEINYIDPVIGAHSGPGTVALFFIANKR